MTAWLPWMQILALEGSFPWEKLAGVSGGAVLAFVLWLFISDKVCTRSSAQREIDGWKEVAGRAETRAEKSESRAELALGVARSATDAAERAMVRKRGA